MVSMKPIPVTFRQIEYLLAAAETGSTAGAARTLHVSQPSVSQAIAQIEAHFGAPLFLRQPGKGLRPTPFGNHKLEELAGLVARGRAAFSSNATIAAEVTLGVFSTLGPRYAPRLMRAFREHRPDASIRLVEGDLETLARGLRAGRIDLALVYDVGLPSDLAVTRLLANPPHALVPIDHRLAHRDTVSLRDLASDPVIVIDLPHSRGYFISLFQMAGAVPRIAAETASIEMLRAMVGNGLGVGLLATDLPYDTTYDGGRVVTLKLDAALPPSHVALVRSGAFPPAPMAEAFARLCHEVLASGDA